MTKRCPKCKRILYADKFYRNSRSSDGLACWCKACVKHHVAKWQRSEKGKKARKLTRRRSRENNLEMELLCGARNRAKKQNLEFSITKSDIKIPKVCPVFGTPFELGTGGVPSKYAPSLDRIDSTKGYTKDNIIVLSFRANVLKKDASILELEALLGWMRTVEKETGYGFNSHRCIR